MVKLHPAALAPVKIHVAAASLRPAGEQTSRLGCGPAGPAAGEMPRPCSLGDVEQWVRRYFELMDHHGAFILSAQSGPGDEEVRVASTRLQMRVCFLLGTSLRARQRTPVEAPEALGLAIQAMLDRSWYQCRAQHLPVDVEDVIGTIARTIGSVLAD